MTDNTTCFHVMLPSLLPRDKTVFLSLTDLLLVHTATRNTSHQRHNVRLQFHFISSVSYLLITSSPRRKAFFFQRLPQMQPRK